MVRVGAVGGGDLMAHAKSHSKSQKYPHDLVKILT
jgi:hypothetical protein